MLVKVSVTDYILLQVEDGTCAYKVWRRPLNLLQGQHFLS